MSGNSDTPANGSQQINQISGDGYWVMVLERLNRMELDTTQRLTRIETSLEGIRRDRDEMQKAKDDHENRIRGLERWKYMLPSSLVTAIVAAAVTIYGQVGR